MHTGRFISNKTNESGPLLFSTIRSLLSSCLGRSQYEWEPWVSIKLEGRMPGKRTLLQITYLRAAGPNIASRSRGQGRVPKRDKQLVVVFACGCKLQPSTLTTKTQSAKMEDHFQAMRDTLQDALDDVRDMCLRVLIDTNRFYVVFACSCHLLGRLLKPKPRRCIG